MKTRMLSRMIALFALLSIAALTLSQSYGLKWTPSEGVSNQASFTLRKIEEPFGLRGVTIEAIGFAGVRFEGGKLFGGAALAAPIPVERRGTLALLIGVYGEFESGHPVRAGIYLGLRL